MAMTIRVRPMFMFPSRLFMFQRCVVGFGFVVYFLVSSSTCVALPPPPPPPRPSCPCTNLSACHRLRLGDGLESLFQSRDDDWEVFAFTPTGGQLYPSYDWSILTTLAWVNNNTAMCVAHEHGRRAVSLAKVDANKLASADEQELDEMATGIATDAYVRFLDGVNFDVETPTPSATSALSTNYVRLIEKTSRLLKSWSPDGDAQISVDVAWSPGGIDGRWYANSKLVEVADVVFIMAYDMQSQNMQSRCVAGANSPYELVRHGLAQWIALTGNETARNKLVLGLPWYGYKYPCVWLGGTTYDPSSPPLCSLKSVPFRGASCSDAAGAQLGLAEVVSLSQMSNASKIRVDASSRSPAFEVQNTQIWFDSATSLALKVQLARAFGLRGVGMWHVDALQGLSDKEMAAMWNALAADSNDVQVKK